MATYADVAVLATRKLQSNFAVSAREAWDVAVAEAFPDSPSMQAKGCPRTTFLAVCASGALAGIAPTGALRDSENVRHAQDCLLLLKEFPDYMDMSPRKLWALLTHASGKTYNQQMHVVIGLAKAGMLDASFRQSTT